VAQNEDALWDILELLHGNDSGWTAEIAGREHRTDIENGYAVTSLKSRLVLKYLPSDIEDTIYFMKSRDYLIVHGQGMIMPEAVYSLSEKAISVYMSRELPEEERQAFKNKLWNIEPKLYGVGPNIKGWKKWWSKLRKRRNLTKRSN
jgi:hypothetical protein